MVGSGIAGSGMAAVVGAVRGRGGVCGLWREPDAAGVLLAAPVDSAGWSYTLGHKIVCPEETVRGGRSGRGDLRCRG